MCGIAGVVGHCATNINLNNMLAKQVHRGPDGEGRHIEPGLAMGMRRLSIIDLETGWQPLTSNKKRVLAFQNGEIYNHKELRREIERLGYQFTTQSDTEVLAHGYHAWGIDKLLERIDGMYAISILDRDRREIHLARDRFGEKPLFYTVGEGCFAYSSSLKSLAVLPWFDKSIDPYGLDRYLALHYVPGDHTIFNRVRKLLPGCTMTISIDQPVPDGLQLKYRRYYRPPLNSPSTSDRESLRMEMQKSVQTRLLADVPVGVFLSGGIDSSILAAFASKINQDIRTYSIGFPGYEGDETRYAEAVARHLGTRHKTFPFDSLQFNRLLPKVAAALDEPIGDQAALPLYSLCNEASSEVKVVLSGEGGDELFGGYGYYSPFAVPSNWPEKFSWLIKNKNRVSPEILGEAQSASGFPTLTSASERARLTGISNIEQSAWEADLLDWLKQSRDPLQRASAVDLMSWLPDNLLVKLDRICMAHSIEGRAPFLNPALASIALNLLPEQRLGKTTKVSLREIASGLLPVEILRRPKQGFVLPMQSWIDSFIEENGGYNTYFSDPIWNNLNMQSVSLFDKNFSQNRSRLVFSLLILKEWFQNFDQ